MSGILKTDQPRGYESGTLGWDFLSCLMSFWTAVCLIEHGMPAYD
jgi:hypothetical protein